MRMTHQINKSSPDICFVPLPALGPGDKETHPCPPASPSLGGEGITELCSDHRVWSPGLQSSAIQPSAESPGPQARPEGKDQGDLSETFPSRLFVTSSDNDFQLLWNMKNL